MKDLLEKIKILKVGTANSDYPVYAQFLYSKDGVLQTTNGKDFVNLEYDLPFEGLINLYVLESFLKQVDDIDKLEFYQDNDSVFLKAGVLTAKLNMLPKERSSFPEIKFPSLSEKFEITEDIMEQLETAFKFVGNNIYGYVYIGKEGIISSDMYKAFMFENEFQIKNPIGLSKKMLPVLKPGVKIALSEGNVVVFLNEEDFVIFSDLYSMESYPYEKVFNFIKKSRSGVELCNILPIRNALDKLMPILHNEKLKLINMCSSENNIMDISAISEINGTSNYRIKVLTGKEFDISMDASNIINIPISFDLYLSDNDRLYLNDGESEIAVLGMV